MKMRQCSCTCIAHFKVLLPKWCHFVTSHDGTTSCWDVTWHHTIGQGFVSCHSSQKKVRWIAWKFHFITWWPWPRYLAGWLSCNILCFYLKRFRCESADTQTHAHTDRIDSVTSTTDTGGNKSAFLFRNLLPLKYWQSDPENWTSIMTLLSSSDRHST